MNVGSSRGYRQRVWFTTLLWLCLGQAEATAPPSLPRVTRVNGEVCVEALDDRGVVTLECRAEGTPWSAPKAQPLPPTASPRLVAGLNLGLGVLTNTRATLPEVAFVADVGVQFPNGAGVVGLFHAHVSPLLGAADLTLWQRYGLGAALRLGTRSHLLLGLTGTLRVVQDLGLLLSPAVSIVVKGALVISDSFTLLLLPVFTLDDSVTFSLSVGVGATL